MGISFWRENYATPEKFYFAKSILKKVNKGKDISEKLKIISNDWKLPLN